ncbi:unnamed protein product, partial [marine sediment metagenome]
MEQKATPEDIIALHEEGLSRPEIATKLGITYSVVESRLRRAGLTPHVTRRAPVKTSDIIALHEEGLSPSEIATKLNITYHSAWSSLTRAGLKPHPTFPLPTPTEDIIALHEEGLSIGEIAPRLNTTYDVVRKRLKVAGLTPHPDLKYIKSAERIRDIVSLHEEGLSPRQIAKRLDLSWELVRKR